MASLIAQPQPIGVPPRRGAARRQRFGAAAKLGVALVTLGAGITALTVADGGTRDVSHNMAAQLILAFSFLFALGVIVTASLSSRVAISIQILMLYFAIYLILPGYNHATRGSFPFFDMDYPSWMVQNASLIVLLFLMAVTTSYALMNSKRMTVEEERVVTRFEPNRIVAGVLILCAYAGAALFIRTLGLSGVFNGRDQALTTSLDAQASAIVLTLPRMLCLISLIYAIAIFRYSKYKGLGLVLLLVNFIPSIFVLWPLSMQRSTLFGIILFVSMMLFRFDRADRRLGLSIAYLFGALVAMPFMDAITRGGRKLEEVSASYIMGRYFQSGDFDGLQSITNVVLHTNRLGYEYGHQLLSACLFFVPRSFWSGKGEPTGSVVAETAGYKFLNVSMPLPGEFFIDAGWIGVVGGGLILGVILQKIDLFIDRNWYNSQKGRLLAGLMAGYTIVIYRGTLIAIIGPFAVLAVLVFFTSKFGLRPVRNRPV